MKDKNKDWYQPQAYLHITARLDRVRDRRRLVAITANPELVARHAFFPLLHKKIVQRRYKVVGKHPIKGTPMRGHSEIDQEGSIKPTRKIRHIHYATHIDSQIYAYYAKEILRPRYEALLAADVDLNQSIVAYRRVPIEGGRGCKGNIHFAKEVFDAIAARKDCVAMAFDIENFFPSLNHKRLKWTWANLLGTKSLPRDHYNIFKSITRFSYIELNQLREPYSEPGRYQNVKGFDERRLALIRKTGYHAFFESVEAFRKAIHAGELRIRINEGYINKGRESQGIPQGLVISPLLANAYMLDFDRVMVEKVVKEWQGLYRRYSDDIVIIVSADKAEEVQALVQHSIKKAGLVISKEKTEICRFERNVLGELDCYGTIGRRPERKGIPFSYLGFEFDGRRVLIRAKNVSKFYRRMKESIKSKANQIRKVKDKTNEDYPVVYYRKLFRAFTSQGARKKVISGKKSVLKYNALRGEYQFQRVSSKSKYWGNTIGYVMRAAEIMGQKSIEQQFRNHRKILKRAMRMRGLM